MNPLDYSFFFNKKLLSTNPDTLVSKTCECLFNKFNHSARNSLNSKFALNNILTNLIVAHIFGRYIIISKSPNEYSNYSFYGLKHYSYRLIIGWIELLLEQGYINQVKSYYDSKSKIGKRPRLWISEKLISSFEDFRNNCAEIQFAYYTRPIVLKDKSKNVIQYKPSGNVLEKIKFLNIYNEFIESNQIIFPVESSSFDTTLNYLYPISNQINLYHSLYTQLVFNKYHSEIPIVERSNPIPLLITLESKSLLYKRLSGVLYRVFNNGSFSQGGRFYSSYQQLNGNDRIKILINGSSVSEVDYSAYHLNMLYHLTKKQFGEDPYSVVDRSEVRPILKVLCLIVINSRDKTQALRALNYEIRKNREFQKLKRIYQLDEKELLRKFENVHSEISNYFCSGIGLKLQFVDSQITESILKHFTKRDIPCLSIHDSFIVPAEHQRELAEMMNKIYKKRFGYDAKLK